ncbi:MAG: PaaI family thioesterase [Gammaproteobacteria bacterium]
MTNRHTPRNPAYVARVHASLASQPFMDRLIDAHAIRVEPGFVEVAAMLRPDLLQPGGHAHGTVLAALGDSAAGYAAQTLVTAAFDIVTVEFKINFLAPAFGPRVAARGRVLRAGRTLSACAAELVSIADDGAETAVAYLVTTMMAVPVHD